MALKRPSKPAKRVAKPAKKSASGLRKRAGGASASSTKKSSDGVMSDDDLKALVPKGLAATFVKSKLHDKALEVAGLGEMEDWTGDMPELPNDIASKGHDELSDLLAQFTNAMSTSLWQASKHYVEADAYEEIADYLYNQAILSTEETNDTKRKADAETQPEVVAARALQKASYHNYVRHRDMARTLEKRAAVVSRVGGFVGDEAEAEEQRASKSSTRGRSLGASRGSSKGSTKLKPKR